MCNKKRTTRSRAVPGNFVKNILNKKPIHTRVTTSEVPYKHRYHFHPTASDSERRSDDLNQNHAMSADPGMRQNVRERRRKVMYDSLMTRACGSVSSSGRAFGAFGNFSTSTSTSTTSVMASDRVVSGNDPAADRTSPPRATDASRIEMRLFRDTRRVLEYLSRMNIGQQCVA